MAKFTDVVEATLAGYFNAGDQPTEAQFTALMAAIQAGIDEHDHLAVAAGDGLYLDRIARFLATSKPYNSKGNEFNTVQAAIDDLETGPTPGWVFVPAGTWNERLTIAQSYIEVFGTGWGSIIHETAESGHAITVTGGGVVVRNLQCYTTQAGGNAYDGIHSTGADIRILEIFVNGSDRRCINKDGGLRGWIRGCLLLNSDEHGIFVAEAGTSIVDNKILSSGVDGINLFGAAPAAADTVITGNFISTCGGDGIELGVDADNCVVVGNRIKGCTEEAIDNNSGSGTIGNNDTT